MAVISCEVSRNSEAGKGILNLPKTKRNRTIPKNDLIHKIFRLKNGETEFGWTPLGVEQSAANSAPIGSASRIV